MDFVDRIQELATKLPKQIEYCQTEEATKNALVMPMINALGYNVFDPTEVMPEFTADIGIKKGEKIDYAIFKDGNPIILFECKWAKADLAKAHASQLYRYFNTLPGVRFAVLTNGVEYRFYSDLDSPNMMDQAPFFIFDLRNYSDRHVEELKKFTKTTFNLEEILTNASDLKYTAAIKAIIAREFEQPSEDFVKFFASQVYGGRLTQSVREQFADITAKALRRFMNEQINERLQSAIRKDEEPAPVIEEAPSEVDEEDDGDKSPSREIHTTEEEIEGFFVIKSILRDSINVKRVHIRDTKSYCGILLDDNNRKPICRLWFNRTQKYLGVLDADKNEVRHPIEEIDDIYQYADAIKAIVVAYDN